MFQKLEDVEKRYDELTTKISDPEVIARTQEWQKLMKEHAGLEDVVSKYREYKKAKADFEEAKVMASDKELRELAEAEMDELREKIPQLEEELKVLLIPKDPDDDKNTICEIRAGAGGEEAALFAGTLFRMYTMYAEAKHWKIEILNENETEMGGYKEVTFMVSGKGVYSRLKFESGVHRVQRVPDTESSGRIHTSTATVAVLPVVEDVETGIVAECQTERSQTQNREYAMRLLKSRLYEIEKQKQDEELHNERKSQVGTGDRSEKIRTYNYPQGRITDHRIGFSIFQMENFLNGDLDEMIDNLIAADRAEKLKGNEEN